MDGRLIFPCTVLYTPVEKKSGVSSHVGRLCICISDGMKPM